MPAYAVGTLTESGQISTPRSDIEEILSDNTALLSEVDALREALRTERVATQALVDEVKAYMKAKDEEIMLKDARIEVLEAEVAEYEKQVRTQKRRATSNIILGIVLGIGVGCVL